MNMQSILAIDDMPANLDMLGAALADEYDLRIATSGEMGLALARKFPPNLILLDVMMPGIDGYEVCRQIKADPALKDIPVIFISALAGVRSESEGLNLGAADYISKPINVEIARRRIKNLLDRERLVEVIREQRDELAKSEAFKRGILDAIDDEIAVLDSLGNIVATNQSWLRFWRENPRDSDDDASELIQRGNYLAVLDLAQSSEEEDRARRAREGILSVLDRSAPFFSIEYPCHSPLEKRWYIMKVTPMGVDAKGGAVVCHTNITARKQEEEKLALGSSVFANAREGIMITGLDGLLIDVNAAFTRITGFTREEALGKNPSILNSGRQEKEFYRAMWESLEKHHHWKGEAWNRRKNGEVYAISLNISAALDGQGNPRHYVGLFSDITSQKEHEDRLVHYAHHDALTNLPNRILLADRLHQSMTRCSRDGLQLAVVYLDLDGFKRVNDLYGHDVGDQLLVHCASGMRHCLREIDTLARLGGDEFVAVLPDLADRRDCFAIIERVLAATAKPVNLGGHDIQVSASVGVTFYARGNKADADQLMREADQAMYAAKQGGKNRYACYADMQDDGGNPDRL